MKEKLVWMFSGQGSQYYHMGSDLYDCHPVFRRWMDTFEVIALEQTGVSLLDALYDPRRDMSQPLDELRTSHPALFMLQYSLAMALWEEGLRPSLVLGASLGEFVAAAICGAAPADVLFKALLKQASGVDKTCPEGGMLAVLEAPEFFRENPGLFAGLELASVNFHKQFTAAGAKADVDAAEKNLAAQGVFGLRLPVRHGFHSSVIDPVETQFIDTLAHVPFREPRHAVISCLTGRPMTHPSARFFWDVVRRPFDFTAALGAVRDDEQTLYMDLGPSGTLANFVKYSLPLEARSRAVTILSPFGEDRRRYDQAMARIKGPCFRAEWTASSARELGVAF